MMFGKAVRGMIPRKTPRGAVALSHLKVFHGIPYPYDQKKRMVIPDALKVLRLRQHRKYTVLGLLASQLGWKRKALVDTLEEKRKEKSSRYHELKQKKVVARNKANQSKEVEKINTELAKYGF
jgi:large subunit ribosomal protein L13Ae